jgi:hypothetical protein
LPVGTRYVVEGRAIAAGKFRVSARYLVFPDGRRVAVPGKAELPIGCGCGASARRRPVSRVESALQPHA